MDDAKKSKIKKLVILAVVIAVGGWLVWTNFFAKPADISDEVYESGIYAIKSIDMFLDGEIEKEALYERLDSLDTSYIQNTEFKNDNSVRIEIFAAKVACNSYPALDVSKLKECRNEIAELLNYKK